MNKLVLTALLATLLAACSTPPVEAPKKDEAPTPVVVKPTADMSDAERAAAEKAAAAKLAADKLAAEQALRDAAQAKLDADKRIQENLLKSNSVYFDFNQFNITDDYKAIVEAHANYAKSSGTKVKIEGNADERGSREYNLSLGQKRANAVAKSMEVMGVNKASIETISYGKEKPRAEGHDEDAWSVNRRADIVYPGK